MDVSAKLQEYQNKFKSVEVDKAVPVEFDLGNLLALDGDAVDTKLLSKTTKEGDREAYLKAIARDSTQLLVNAIFSLPTNSTEEGIFAQLPEPTFALPRAKPCPKAAPMTRWEKFAKAKGIQKKKKSRMQYDEASGDYKPTWGYKGKNDMSDWLIEVPDNAGPDVDMYEQRREEKQERVKKNKMQQKRNMEEQSASASGKNPREVRKAQLQKQLLESKKSTASLGKFDQKLKNEPKLKSGVRRQFEPNTPAAENKDKSLKIASKVLKSYDSGDVNVSKAVKELHQGKRPPSDDRGSNKKKRKQK